MDYPLLVEKILKNTDPNHPDYHFLQKALKMSKNLCEQVNEGTRHKENTERLEWLQIHVDSAKNPGLYSIFIINLIYIELYRIFLSSGLIGYDKKLGAAV